MVAWMNREALEATLRHGRQPFLVPLAAGLWRKGETSGHVQHVDGVYADCDGDTLLVQVHQEGVACHTGARTCFFTPPRVRRRCARASRVAGAGPATLEVVERVLQSRNAAPPPGSYVAGLLARGEARSAARSARRPSRS